MTQDTQAPTLWDAVKTDFRDLFPDDVYRTWFEPMSCLDEREDSITLGVPNDFAAIWVQDNYQDLITRRLGMAAGRSMSLRFEVADNGEPELEEIETSYETTERVKPRIQPARIPTIAERNLGFVLNPKNTFNNFVVGSGNQLAHAASIAIANEPAKAYNPLFLYGDNGLGKTHLMQAVAQHTLNSNNEARIAYISTETFTNEFISAIQDNTVTRFRQRYRQVDVLLIDDVHFLSGKERIQEEFFHTFNVLFESQKQIVLSSDRPASEIAKLENRLVSRFQWGLVADIQAPDFETRLAILTKKAQAMGIDVSDEVLQFLAERVARNVRRMEGALTRVAGYASLIEGKIDIEVVEKLLGDILQEEAQNQITIEKIQEKVADYYKLRLSDMVSKRRPANIAFPRQIAMSLSRTLTSHSLQEIGQSFGGRDHGTVIHACKTVENMMEQDDSVSRAIEYLQKQLTSSRH
ncbi:chromosomal replication initiator protein DnaA [Rubellicoccus peritrichatus]|uniref:Chromosomal replication initiator protein DnaA n=1 Tax=Rubellicoccus peritrichatus TaxID=3080537 RepID=A0AAQ3LG13_9BACT|nr:chromosomal replication initiator protein DnaA [Puniceicoccus sp. CR14]WOO41449.1 chromosomal replication initiator protein DnaA [Puniceicoccus sp. CR14]